MSISRREFLAAAAAACCAGCRIANKAPTFEAAEDGSLPVPEPLAKPGSQVKVRIPGNDDVILVWRTDSGFGAASVICTHRACEVAFNPEEKSLDCPCHGSRFQLDGKVLEGPAKKPLRAYRVTEEAGRIRIRPA